MAAAAGAGGAPPPAFGQGLLAQPGNGGLFPAQKVALPEIEAGGLEAGNEVLDHG